MKSVEVYFSDLSKAKQAELLEAAGVQEPAEMNWNLFPVTVIDFYDEDE